MPSIRLASLPLLLIFTAASPPEIARWKAQAANVTITRDDWGIAHVHGKTDADAVFGMIYAQAEDDFRRIEDNYLTSLGRKAEAEGEKAIWEDLRARLYVSEAELRQQYAKSPAEMRRLMDAWAAGLNFYLATHPGTRARVIKRFEPWMVMSFTEGSIGGDIEYIDLGELERFYTGKRTLAAREQALEPTGSNGIAIAAALTEAKRPLLLINPHTSLFFRSEQQVTSDEGLNVYGAATWGQFFIYQGFNASAGWMHTSSGVDNVDEFAETIRGTGKARCYAYGTACRPIGVRPVTIRYRTGDGRLASRSFDTYFTHHGPVVRHDGDRWIAFSMMNRPVEALQQSFLRTKAADFAGFLQVSQRRANSSNSTLFADKSGTIAYLHPQFVPRRAGQFDFMKPVDGSNPLTDWGSLHSLTELPNVINPPNGWVQNTNAWPYRAAGAFSPNPVRYPRYMDQYGENFRGLHAVQLLQNSRNWTIPKLQAAAFDPYQPGFAALLPTLQRAVAALPAGDPRKPRLIAPSTLLRGWDYRWSAESTAQTLAMAWLTELMKLRNAPANEPSNITFNQLASRTTAGQKVSALDTAVSRLERDFGRWQVPWGEVNRAQRLASSAPQVFDDNAPSTPVPFASGRMGSLASLSSKAMPGTRRWYGETGNSFVAIAEFGPRVRAVAVSAGGASGDPKSPHFLDQMERYAAGQLRPVYFHPDELQGHVERSYRPGE